MHIYHYRYRGIYLSAFTSGWTWAHALSLTLIKYTGLILGLPPCLSVTSLQQYDAWLLSPAFTHLFVSSQFTLTTVTGLWSLWTRVVFFTVVVHRSLSPWSMEAGMLVFRQIIWKSEPWGPIWQIKWWNVPLYLEAWNPSCCQAEVEMGSERTHSDAAPRGKVGLCSHGARKEWDQEWNLGALGNWGPSMTNCTKWERVRRLGRGWKIFNSYTFLPTSLGFLKASTSTGF